jgi:Ca-activated chloride channel homolog
LTECVQNGDMQRGIWKDLINKLFVVGLVATTVALKVYAQDEDKVVRVDTELAEFEVLVEDKNGKPVHGLRAEDFRIFENGKLQRIDFFQPVRSGVKTRPMVIVFAVDVSGSMTEAELEKLRTAINGFVDRFGDYESYFALVAFAMEVKKIQSFTNRPDTLKRSLAKFDHDQDGRSTHAFDAVDASIRMIDKNTPRTLHGRAPKRAIILITDGFPVGDVVAPNTVIERANNAGVSVYSIILPSFSPVQRDSKPIMTLLDASGLVQRTGGSSLVAIDNNYEPLFQALAAEITSSYALAYHPVENRVGENPKRNVVIESVKGYKVKQNRTSFELKK